MKRVFFTFIFCIILFFHQLCAQGSSAIVKMPTLKDLHALELECCQIIKQDNRSTDEIEKIIAKANAVISLIEHDLRGSRPEAESPNAVDAIVGKNSCDITPIIAAIGTLKKLILQLELILCDKFQQTWTILNHIEQEFTGVFTALNNLSVTATVDLSGVYTAIDDCCQLLDRDIIDTRTILCDKFQQTWTILQSIENDISGVFTALNISCTAIIDLSGVFTALNNLSVTATVDFSGIFTAIDDCCQLLDRDIIDTRTILCDKFQQTWTILEALCPDSIPIGGPTVITQPGNYCLTNDIAGQISIAADRVTIFMHGRKISNGAGDSLLITPNHHDIVILGGYIQNSGNNDIHIINGQNITINDIDFTASPTAILIETATGISINNCTYKATTEEVMTMTGVVNVSINNCVLTNNSAQACIHLTNAQDVVINNILITNNVTPNDFVGIFCEQQVSNVHVNATHINRNAGDNLAGILFLQSSGLTISSMQVNNNTADTILFPFGITDSNDVKISHCESYNNSSQLSLLSFFMLNTNNISCDYCSSDSNGAPNLAAFFGALGNDVSWSHCTANANLISSGDATIFHAENIQAVLIESCVANDNQDLIGSVTAFHIQNCNDVILDSCISMSNVSPASATGIGVETSDNVCIFNAIAKENNGNESGYGIVLQDCTQCTVKNNLISGNKGSAVSIGLEVSNTGGLGKLTSSIFANQSQDHTTNYFISPGSIFTVVITRDPLSKSAAPTPVDNLDIS